MATILQCAASAILWRYSLLLVLLLSMLLSWAPFTRASTQQQPPQPEPEPEPEPEEAPPGLPETPPLFENSRSIAKILRSAGYNMLARTLEMAASVHRGRDPNEPNDQNKNIMPWWNGTGTLLAPSDSAFARIAKTRPLSYNVLLYHTTKTKVTWKALEKLPAGTGLSTFMDDRCLFLCRTSGGGLCVAAKNQSTAHRAAFRHPDLYSDGALSIHGVDRIINPAAGSNCATGFPLGETGPARPSGPPALSETRTVAFAAPLLTDAMRVLQRSGYGVLAMAMHMKSSELLVLDKMTIFALSDETLFSGAEGFYYNFLYHVVPHRLPLLELLRLPLGTRIDTLVPGSSILVTGTKDEFSIDNVGIKEAEIFHNEIMVVHEIPVPLQPKNALSSVVASERRGSVPDSSSFKSRRQSPDVDDSPRKSSRGFEPGTMARKRNVKATKKGRHLLPV